MSDEIKHECAVALVVLRKNVEHYRRKYATGDYGGVKLSLLMEKQHNRGQDGAGASILAANPEPGSPPYWIAKSASGTPLADVLGMIGRRERGIGREESIFLGHLRYATFGKNDVACCHPFVHESSELEHTLLLAGNFNLTNAHELFDDYAQHGSFPTSKADGYLLCELIAKELGRKGLQTADVRLQGSSEVGSPKSEVKETSIAAALSKALEGADGAWTLCGMTGDGWAFATRDPHGIRPGFCYVDDEVVVVASERPAIQAAFDVPPEAVKELPPGKVLVVSPEGEVECCQCGNVANTNNQYQLEICNIATGSTGNVAPRPCSFERIYFSRANDAAIHRERKALGATLVPQILEAADAPLEDIFFSYIPNSARIAFHGLLEAIFNRTLLRDDARTSDFGLQTSIPEVRSQMSDVLPIIPRFGEVIVKDAKFRTFIADAAARREFYKHVYDVTYGLVRPGRDTLVVLDDSIVRGNTMKNAILPMLDRLGPKRIVIASSAPPIRYPDCYGIDMSTLGELVAFKALVNLLGKDAEKELAKSLAQIKQSNSQAIKQFPNPLAPLYARFTEELHAAEIARLLTPPGMKAEVVVVYQTIGALRKCLQPESNTASNQPSFAEAMEETPIKQSDNRTIGQFSIGDWYFSGDYPTPGGYKVLRKAIHNYLEHTNERSY